MKDCSLWNRINLISNKKQETMKAVLALRMISNRGQIEIQTNVKIFKN